MTKISSQPAYKPDREITGKDYLVGTDADKANKPTVSFLLEDLGRHFNMVNGSRNFDYLFYNHLGVSQAPANGCFYSNDNEQNPNNITHFFISKYTSSNKDVSQFFDSITTTNPFDLIVSQKIGLNSIFFFTISDVESINGYYKLTVSEKFFPDSLIVEYKASNLVFNLKPNSESIHNNLSGLNEGDYIHLTEIEKQKFDSLPNTFVTNHSQLSLNDGTNPHGTTKTDVGLSNINNTSDADKPVSTAQQTALNLKQDNLTETNFGTFSNSLTTEDTIPDAGIFNYTNVLGIQVKTTWANIKAKLASIFLTKVSTVDVEKVYIKNADGTQGMKPVSELLSEILITNAAVTGTYNIDWTAGDVWNLTLTGNTTLTESNLPASGTTKTINLQIVGNYTLAYPTDWTDFITGSFIGAATLNTLTCQYFGSTKYKVQIVQPT